MAELHQLQVKITADAAGVRAGMQQAVRSTEQATRQLQQSFAGVKSALRDLAPYIASAFALRAFKGIVDGVDRLNDLANQLDVSTESLSAFAYAAKLSGTSLEQVAQGLRLMGDYVGNAASGVDGAGKALKDLKLDAGELVKLPLDQQFERIAGAMNGIGNQNRKIADARDIFGRMGVELLPLIRDFQDLKQEAHDLGYTVGDESAQRFAMLNDEIDRMSLAGEGLSRTLLEMVVPALSDTLSGINQLFQGATNTSKVFNQLGAAYVGGLKAIGLIDKDVADAAFDEAGDRIQHGQKAAELQLKIARARGQGGGKPAPAVGGKPKGDPIRDYLQNLKDTNQELNTPEPLRSAQKAEDDLRLLAMKEGKKLTQDQIALARELAAANRELTDPNPINEYIEKLREEQAVYTADEKTQTGLKAYYDLVNQTKKDGIAISEQEKQQIMGLANANEELKKKTEESQQAAKKMKDDLTDGLTDIILHFDSATDSAKKFFDEIAAQILKKSVTGPLSAGIMDAIGGKEGGGLFSGLGKLLGFAGGGSPPVGVPSIVGERGPEIFVPNTAGTIIPNHALGTSVTVHQSFNMSPGLQGTVEAEVRRAAPSIAAAAKAAVFQSIEKGGRESQLVNRRT